MPARFTPLHVPVKTLTPLLKRAAKLAANRPRESMQISSRLVSDILRPVKNARSIRG